MSPQRARTYGWLFIAMSASVCANILYLQPRLDGGKAGNDARALRLASPQSPARQAQQLSDTVRAIQRELKEINMYPGPVDGKPALLLHAAILAFEQAQALPITGEPTQALLRDLIVGPTSTGAPSSYGAGVVSGSAAERVVKDVKQRLVALGYSAGAPDGRLTLDLIQGIRAFERDNRLPQTGRVSAHLLVHLQRSAAAFKPRQG